MQIYKKLLNSTKWSLAGLKYTFKHELAFRLEILIAMILSPVAYYVATDLTQFLLLLVSLHLILIVELINTAIEAVVDRVGLEQHTLSKHAKDAGSAAVFWSITIMIIVWGVIIWSNIQLYNF